MLVSMKSILGFHIETHDGVLGKVSDFYFDDQSWRLRYVIVNLGTPFCPHEALIDATVLGRPDATDRLLPVRLTQSQLMRCPESDTAKPVSRQEEEKRPYLRSLPLYWESSVFVPTLFCVSNREARENTPVTTSDDPHLRSFREIKGYHVKTLLDDRIGVVEDFILDVATRRLTRLVVHTGNRFFGRRVSVGVEFIDTLTWAQQCVDLRLTESVIEGDQPVRAGAAINEGLENRRYDHLGRPTSRV